MTFKCKLWSVPSLRWLSYTITTPLPSSFTHLACSTVQTWLVMSAENLSLKLSLLPTLSMSQENQCRTGTSRVPALPLDPSRSQLPPSLSPEWRKLSAPGTHTSVRRTAHRSKLSFWSSPPYLHHLGSPPSQLSIISAPLDLLQPEMYHKMSCDASV